MTDLTKALVVGFDFTEKEATKQISTWRTQVWNGANPEELLYDFGLEPDYVFDLLTF